MSKALALGLLLIAMLPMSVSAKDDSFPRCNCDGEGGLWSIEGILDYQRVMDFFIAVAYFSIPIELLYFVSCSNVPFKWVLFEFIAFIVLCGLTHLLNGWTYGPPSFELMLSITVLKILTALVSCAIAITLVTRIPLLLKVKVREFMLHKKARDLGHEVGMIMKQKEAGLHVRMLTQEIRKSLDRHTILYTTLVELSKTLELQNCAVWMPNAFKTEMNLTYELNGGNFLNMDGRAIPITDPDVVRIKASDGVNILRPDSVIAAATCRESDEPGPVAAIRMPMLHFKGGTPEMIQTCYGILVLVLPNGEPRSWANQELEIIKVVADQVTVALSHAGVLEDSQLLREKLEEQNRNLQQAKRNAMMASQARNAFQMVISEGMKRPMHSILGLVSTMQDENLGSEQQIIVSAMKKTSNVLSMLINDVEISAKDSGRFQLEMTSFQLHNLIREAACVAKCLCACKGFGFSIVVDRSLPVNVMGDERRVFQVILHVVGNLLNGNNRRGTVVVRVSSEKGSQERNDQSWTAWRQNTHDEDVYVRFEITITNCGLESEDSSSMVQLRTESYASDRVYEGLSFSICKRLVQHCFYKGPFNATSGVISLVKLSKQIFGSISFPFLELVHGKIWVIPNPQGFAQSMGLVLRFQL